MFVSCIRVFKRVFLYEVFFLLYVCVCVYVFVFCDKFVGNIRWQQSQTCEGRPSEKEFRLCSGSELSSLTNYLVIEEQGSDRVFCECFFASSQNPESSQFKLDTLAHRGLKIQNLKILISQMNNYNFTGRTQERRTFNVQFVIRDSCALTTSGTNTNTINKYKNTNAIYKYTNILSTA